MVSEITLPKIGENEAIVFDIEPHFSFIQLNPRNFVCAFCEILRSSGISVIVCSTLRDFLSTLEFSPERTPIDHLLSEGSFFTHMPEQVRGLALQIRPFEFVPSVETISTSEYGRYWIYQKLVARELFRDEPEIAKLYEVQLTQEERLCKLSSSGHFAYDMDDPLLGFIISKAKHILSNEPIKQLIERYLKLLATCCLFKEFFRMERLPALSVIVLLEKTIVEMLDYPEKYVPLEDRMGKVAAIYCQC